LTGGLPIKAIKTLPQISADARLKEMVRRILLVGDPQKIILFGSRARGNAQPDSDYDLLLIESSDLPRYKRAAKYRRALIGASPAKDILVWTPEEVAEWCNVPNAFITTVLNEGIVLHERQG
jgi:predicted nucleotidyltransferase